MAEPTYKLGYRMFCPDCHGSGFEYIQYDDDPPPGECKRCEGTCWVDEPDPVEVPNANGHTG